MIRAGIIGLGKMGISHCAIVNAQPDVNLIAVSDTSGFVLSAIKKYTQFKCYKDYKEMINKSNLQCVFISTPTKFHIEMIQYALERDIHVFVEKPFCLDSSEAQMLIELAQSKNLINQVGYHNRFIGTFQEMKKLLDKKVIGDLFYFKGESYGPVVLKPKGSTWRSKKSEGGGCLYDYTSHVVNLLDYIIGTPDFVQGTSLGKIYSKDVDDATYSTLCYNNGLKGHLSVNWSDETYRKMSTLISAFGSKGKLITDSVECKIYLREDNKNEGLQKGWNMRYITDTTEPVGFNLRGEEYSAQVEYFIKSIKLNNTENKNSFATALRTDQLIDLLRMDAEKGEQKNG